MFGHHPPRPEGRPALKDVDTIEVYPEILYQAPGTEKSRSHKVLVGAIDQGTSSTRFLLFAKNGSIVAWAQKETTQIFPTDREDMVGWHEHDPFEIWETVVACMNAVIGAVDNAVKNSPRSFLSGYDIASIGITNQRETTVAWNADSGEVYHNAIVWDDTRTVSIAKSIANGDADRLRYKTGLPLASYFAGTKVRWLLDNVEELRKDLEANPEPVRFGTIDTWLVYQLTGKPSMRTNARGNVGGIFVTDASNASRWLFLDIHRGQWCGQLVNAVCGPHTVPLTALPEVKPSSGIYATLESKSTGLSKLEGVPVAAILGDQQAAMFGQVAFEPGEAKNTYGTGMFLMMNTGTKLVPSKHGLLTTIAYKIGDETIYALEGSVSHSGSTVQWLRDQLKIIEKASDTEEIATPTNDGLYLVPAFAGLFAPHWRPDARGCVVGITAAHHAGHFARAALEATAYQCRELFEAIKADSGVTLKALKVDGGGSHNKLLMQFQADQIDAPVVIPKVQETTAMGAAFAAGLAVGVWKDRAALRDMWEEAASFVPSMTPEVRQKNWAGWQKAITRSLNWVDTPEGKDNDGATPSSVVDAAATSNSGIVLSGVCIVCGVGLGFLLGRQRR